MSDVMDKVRIDDCEAVHSTDLALLVRFPDGDEHWIPQSVIDDDSEVYQDGDEGTLVIAEWFAKKEDLT